MSKTFKGIKEIEAAATALGLEVVIEDALDGPGSCLYCGKYRKHMQTHIKTVHPEHYVPKPSGRGKKPSAPLGAVKATKPRKSHDLPAEGVLEAVLTAVYGKAVPIEHVQHVVVFAGHLDTFLKAVK